MDGLVKTRFLGGEGNCSQISDQPGFGLFGPMIAGTGSFQLHKNSVPVAEAVSPLNFPVDLQ